MLHLHREHMDATKGPDSPQTGLWFTDTQSRSDPPTPRLGFNVVAGWCVPITGLKQTKTGFK